LSSPASARFSSPRTAHTPEGVPYHFDTPLNAALVANPEFDAWLKSRTPAGRWGRVEELQGATIFLASAASDFVNGQVIYVDGGVLATL
jgi:gluconate 5-dehydrogenase